MELINYIPLLVIWAGGVIFFRVNKIWVFYFLWGAIGFTVLAAFMLQGTIIETTLSRTAIKVITYFNAVMKIPVMPFADVGTMLMTGTLMSGYTSLEIGTECSGLLEGAVFWGLTMFYPVFDLKKKIETLIIGSILIYFVNLLRVQLIVTAIFLGGRNTIFVAHTILGRGVFFLMMIVLYWFFFTRRTLFFIDRQSSLEG